MSSTELSIASSSESTLEAAECTALMVAQAPQKPSISKRIGDVGQDVSDWAQALAATCATRALHKAQGSMHRV
ncbi:MAG: hypothetical protein GY822_09210 [Deltaproteobacteria bacterium]|nr:hypothetical protein [Deltaproteobacteria bacterium]